MKTNTLLYAVALCCLCTTFICTPSHAQTKDPLARSPIVAKRTGSLTTCELKALKDTIDLPLSQLTEELQIVKLDNRDEALIGGWTRTTIGKNHILISNNKQTPYKLFSRSGKFIANIGSYGQGPNEYLNTYAEQLDEEHNRIYILPWQSDKLLVFNLKGEVQPSIPLGTRVPKGQFRVNGAKSELTVTALPFKGSQAVVWTQDFKGKRKSMIAPRHLEVPQDFSNEVMSDNNTPGYNVMLAVIMPPRIDSLYRYNPAANKLEACFTTTHPQQKLPWHHYSELPAHYIGNVSLPIQVSENTFTGSKPACYIVNKKSLRGSYFRLYNDFLGTTDMGIWTAFSNGYYVINQEPMQLQETLEKELKKKNLSPAARARAKKLFDSLNENDNNVVIFAKLKP